jgi:hypothetical protein
MDARLHSTQHYSYEVAANDIGQPLKNIPFLLPAIFFRSVIAKLLDTFFFLALLHPEIAPLDMLQKYVGCCC